MGVRVKGIADVDGSTVELDFSDSNIQRLSSLLSYTYSSTKSPPPVPGQVISNGSTPTTNTIWWVHRLDSEGRDLKFFLLQIKEGDRFYAQEFANADTFELYDLTEDPIDSGDHITFHVKSVGIQMGQVEQLLVPGGAILLAVSI